MTFRYNSVVPWGRTFEEYVGMFRLTEEDLNKRILGCGDGPASFNSVMAQKGKKVVSIDPIYQLTAAQIKNRIEETYENVIAQTEKNKEKFIWTRIKSVEDLGAVRMKAMNEFLKDYEKGKTEGRYIYAEMPRTPFGHTTFDLSLSSHFLFLYTDNLSLDFHFQSIDELCRISKEVRIFPLLDVNAKRSPYVDEVKRRYEEMNYYIIETKVDYEFQKGGNTMLHLCRY